MRLYQLVISIKKKYNRVGDTGKGYGGLTSLHTVVRVDLLQDVIFDLSPKWRKEDSDVKIMGKVSLVENTAISYKTPKLLMKNKNARESGMLWARTEELWDNEAKEQAVARQSRALQPWKVGPDPKYNGRSLQGLKSEAVTELIYVLKGSLWLCVKHRRKTGFILFCFVYLIPPPHTHTQKFVMFIVWNVMCWKAQWPAFICTAHWDSALST